MRADACPDIGRPEACLFCGSHGNCLLARLAQTQPPATSGAFFHVYPLEIGQHLYHAGNKLRLLHVVKSGSLKAYITSNNGAEQVVGFYLPGDILGVDALMTRRHVSSAVALESTFVCTVPVPQVERLARRCAPDWSSKLLCAELRREQRALSILGKKTAESRLAGFLVDMAVRLEEHGYANAELNLSMADQDIGDYLGLAVETIGRTLTELRADGVLEVNGRHVSIRDFDMLNTLAQLDQGTHEAEGTHTMTEVNRRYTERLAVRVPMDIFCNQHYLGRFQTRDINPDGAFVESAATELPASGVVEVALAAPELHGDVGRTKALVVRRTDDGMGIWFTSDNEGFSQNVVEVLHTI